MYYPHNALVDAEFKILIKEIEPLARIQEEYQE